MKDLFKPFDHHQRDFPEREINVIKADVVRALFPFDTYLHKSSMEREERWLIVQIVACLMVVCCNTSVTIWFNYFSTFGHL